MRLKDHYDLPPTIPELAEFALDYFKDAHAIRIVANDLYYDFEAPPDRTGPRMTVEVPYLLRLMEQVRIVQQLNDSVGVGR